MVINPKTTKSQLKEFINSTIGYQTDSSVLDALLDDIQSVSTAALENGIQKALNGNKTYSSNLEKIIKNKHDYQQLQNEMENISVLKKMEILESYFEELEKQVKSTKNEILIKAYKKYQQQEENLQRLFDIEKQIQQGAFETNIEELKTEIDTLDAECKKAQSEFIEICNSEYDNKKYSCRILEQTQKGLFKQLSKTHVVQERLKNTASAVTSSAKAGLPKLGNLALDILAPNTQPLALAHIQNNTTQPKTPNIITRGLVNFVAVADAVIEEEYRRPIDKPIAGSGIGSGSATGQAWVKKVGSAVFKLADPDTYKMVGHGFVAIGKSAKKHSIITAFSVSTGYLTRMAIGGTALSSLPVVIIVGALSGIIGGAVRYEFNTITHNQPELGITAASFKAIKGAIKALGTGQHWRDLAEGLETIPFAYHYARKTIKQQEQESGKKAGSFALIANMFEAMNDFNPRSASLATSLLAGMAGGLGGSFIKSGVDLAMTNMPTAASLEQAMPNLSRAWKETLINVNTTPNNGAVLTFVETTQAAVPETVKAPVAAPVSQPVEAAAVIQHEITPQDTVEVYERPKPAEERLADIASQPNDRAKVAAFVASSASFNAMVEHIDLLEDRGVLKGNDLNHFRDLITASNMGNLNAVHELTVNINNGGIFENGDLRRIERMPIDWKQTKLAKAAGFPGGLAKTFMKEANGTLSPLLDKFKDKPSKLIFKI
jgi:hypothetical protein